MVNHPNRSKARRWVRLEDAPLDVLGHVWCTELGDRTDIIGRVVGYQNGHRSVSAPAQGYSFTHFMPLPSPPLPDTRS